MRRPSTRAISWLLLLLILAVAAGLRLWRIDSIPPGFHFDESFEGLEAWRILTEPGYKPIFLTGNFGVPPLNAYANALMFGLFQLLGGQAGPTAMRVTAALFGVLGVLAVYALAGEQRRLQPELTAAYPLLAAAALAVMRWHLHFSRMGIEPVIVPLAWAAASWLLLRGWRTGGWGNFLALGVVLAASLYTYQVAWVIPALVAITALHLLLASPHDPRSTPSAPRLPGLLLAFAVAVVLALPLAYFFLRNPDLLLLRPSQIAISGQEAAPAGFWQNAWATARMFWPLGQTGDLDPRRNLPGAPVLSVWLAVPFFAGLGMALWRWRRPAYALILTGLVGLLLPGVVSDYAPHFHRILGAAAPTALLIALPLAWLLGWARSTEGASPRGALILRRSGFIAVAVVLVLATLTTVRTYFVRWAALPDLFYAFDEGLWTLGQWIAAQPAEMPVYLTPRSADHPTLAFAWREGTSAHPPPTSFDGRHVLPLTAAANPEEELVTVIEHEDFRTPLLLPEVLPDVEVVYELADRQGQPYARAYRRPVNSQPQLTSVIPLDAALGDGIRLLGYQVIPQAPQAGDILYLRLHWGVEAMPTADWTVFNHLVGPPKADGSTWWAGRDSPPGAGSLPTSQWQPGWRIVDEYQIQLPVDLPAGAYELVAGLYQATGQRLPLDSDGVPLGSVTVGPAP